MFETRYESCRFSFGWRVMGWMFLLYILFALGFVSRINSGRIENLEVEVKTLKQQLAKEAGH